MKKAGRIQPLPEAVAALVRDGSFVSLEGFTHLIPFAAGHEVLRQGLTDLTVVRLTPDVLFDQMIGLGRVARVIFSYGGNPGVGSLHRFRDAVEHGWPRPIELLEHSHAGLANAYVAGASNLPFGLLRGYAGTDLPEHSDDITFIDCPFTGEKLTAVRAINPDVTIIHAQQADRQGNVQLWGLSGVQKEAVLAAKHAIVTVEEVVDELDPAPARRRAAVVGARRGLPRPQRRHGRPTRPTSRCATTASTPNGTRSHAIATASRSGWRRTSSPRTRPSERRWSRGERRRPDARGGHDHRGRARAARRRGRAGRGRAAQRRRQPRAAPGRARLRARLRVRRDRSAPAAPAALDRRRRPRRRRAGPRLGPRDVQLLDRRRAHRRRASSAPRRSIASATSTPPSSATTTQPKVRLPGAGGAPEIARSAGRIIVLLRHSPRSFVGELDFITSVGRDLEGPSNGAPGSAVITDLGILRPSADDGELELVAAAPRRRARRRPRGHGLAAARPRAAGGHRAGDRARAVRAARAAGVGRGRVTPARPLA